MSGVQLTATSGEALAALPDTPLYVEGRALLLRGNAVALAGEEAGDWVLCDSASRLIYLAGCPGADLLRRALGEFPGAAAVIAGSGHAGAIAGVLAGWTCDRIRVHTSGRLRIPRPDGVHVTWLRASEIATLDAGDRCLRETLLEASRRAPVAAARAAGRTVSFCFASSQTERHWNVAVETPEPFRRKGYGAACAGWLIEHYLACGRAPVWGAADSNPASLRMAEQLGMVPCGELALFLKISGSRTD